MNIEKCHFGLGAEMNIDKERELWDDEDKLVYGRIDAKARAALDEQKAGTSDNQILFEWSQTKNTGDMRVDLVAFARALLSKYAAPVNEQDAKDAQRYRWLRQMIFDDRIIVAPDRMLHGDGLDSTVDAAIAQQGKDAKQ